MTAADLQIRRATADDRESVVALCRQSLGWGRDDPNEAFFSWKHDENPFGASPTWLAETRDGELAGVRTFLRWRFRRPDGSTVDAVRAVDTATHPDWQGKGIFTRLTTAALPDLTADGVGFVFNTPNDQSRPGYLKMGWQVVGRVPVSFRPGSIGGATRMTSARTAAEKWSAKAGCGMAAEVALADEPTLEALLSATHPTGLATDRSTGYLRWRYRFEPLEYRAFLVGTDPAEGMSIFRLRRRGRALECAICEVLVPDRSALRRHLRSLLRASQADYLVIGGCGLSDGVIPVARLGPILTWKPLADASIPELSDLALSVGDVELF